MVPTNKPPTTKPPATGGAKTDDRRKTGAGLSEMNKDGVQGEGNYAAAREFNEAERKFVASGKVDAAARAAAPKSEAERQAMFAAEQEGKRRAKEEDPALARARPASATTKAPGKDADRKRG